MIEPYIKDDATCIQKIIELHDAQLTIYQLAGQTYQSVLPSIIYMKLTWTLINMFSMINETIGPVLYSPILPLLLMHIYINKVIPFHS